MGRRAVCAVFALFLSASLRLTSCQNLNGCGAENAKGCLKHPSDCTGDDCVMFVTWENTSDGRTRFSMRASQDLSWVAIGLRPESVPAGMAPADVYVCTRLGNAVERTENVVTGNPERFWNSVLKNISGDSVITESISYTDNVVSCVFTRSVNVADDPTFFDISGNNSYYLLMAASKRINANGNISYTHHVARRATPVALRLQLDFDVPAEPELNGCGEIRGCFRYPEGCTGDDDCRAFLTWENTNDGQIKFALWASVDATNTLHWVAFGLRPEETTSGMSPAEVYACTSRGEVRRSENVIPYNSEDRVIPNDAVDVSLATHFAVPDFKTVIKCVFTRRVSLANDETFYDISGNNAYFLLLAIGDGINPDGSITGKIHTEGWPTPAALKLQSQLALPTTSPPGGDLVGCGETKGCFKQPPQCSGSDCQAYLTWQGLQDGQVHFVMMGKAQSYVAFGLRQSNVNDGMFPADVYACTSKLQVKRSENTAAYNSDSKEIPENTVSWETIEFENNVITCSMKRQPFLQGDDTFYNISGDNEYYILLATGSSINNDGSIAGNQHEGMWSTAETFKLTEFGEGMGEPIHILAKAHASLMMIAWIGFASIGITLARFFKPLWPDSTLLGQKVWFTIHRACMLTCVLCFCTAFILIFVLVRGFIATLNAVAVAHAVCGIIVTCLGIINPIMAIFRPHPGTPKRPIFNWAHWSVGTLAHLLGLVTIFLGIGYQTSLLTGLATYAFFIMIGFVIFHCVMWVLFEVMVRMAENKAVVNPAPTQRDTEPNSNEPGGNNDIPLNTKGGDDSTQQPANTDTEPPAGAAAKMILLCIYVVGVLAFLISLVVLVGLAGN